MWRRDFLAAISGTIILSAIKQASAICYPTDQRRRKMHIGTQQGPTTPQMLQFFKRHGVDHICGYPPEPGERGYWTVHDLEQTRELCEQHQISLDMVALPFLTSSHIDREKRAAIMLGASPERDRDIEHINIMTQNCAKVGIPAWKYNLSLLGVPRTASTDGRGGSQYRTWKLADAVADPRLTRAGRVSADAAWERITYFLERVIPVCNEYRIRAACHPHDPGMPREGFQGVDRVLGTVEGLKRFVSIQESPFHGLNFCVGTVSEMLQNPASEIFDVIRYFGVRKKIFNVHLRNIRGHRDSFQEVYLDNGDVDMLRVLQTLAEVNYPYMVMPDHVPSHSDDPGRREGFAYAFGYARGLLRAVNSGA
jgi:mannonate dehydratase